MKVNETPNINYTWACLIVEELVRCGVRCFGIAPGSRSSPLTMAAAANTGARTIVHFDERGLAFYALGHVSVTKEPVALICSSGTAAVNFFPAVVEASKKKLPLILLTADRPPELRDTGAMQTIDQVKLYGNYVRHQQDLPVPTTAIAPEFLLTTVDQAVFRAKDPMPGPVHLNCMFREPLAPERQPGAYEADRYLDSVQHWLEKGDVYTSYTAAVPRATAALLKETATTIRQSAKGIIVVGKIRVQDVPNVLRLSEKLNWPVFPDVVSGLRFIKHPNIIHYYDQLLLSQKLKEILKVETVLHLGGRITSKRFYQWIESHKPAHYITVLGHHLRNDPLHLVTQRLKGPVGSFVGELTTLIGDRPEKGEKGDRQEIKGIKGDKPVNALSNELKHERSDDFMKTLRQACAEAEKQIIAWTAAQKGMTESATARMISELMPEEHGLFLSNSMPVREIDMYAAGRDEVANVRLVGGNRGASGIDGVIATACGFAEASAERATLLIGDLAFLHDLNSLAFLKHLKKGLIIVAVNNDGGGIFSFLPIASSQTASELFEPYFGTPHGLTFAQAAEMFGAHYRAPASMAEFETAYKEALQLPHSSIIEIKTDRNENKNQHKDLQSKIRNSIDKMLK